MLTNLCIYPHLRVAYISTINSGKNVGPYIRDIILINMGKWDIQGKCWQYIISMPYIITPDAINHVPLISRLGISLEQGKLHCFLGQTDLADLLPAYLPIILWRRSEYIPSQLQWLANFAYTITGGTHYLLFNLKKKM